MTLLKVRDMAAAGVSQAYVDAADAATYVAAVATAIAADPVAGGAPVNVTKAAAAAGAAATWSRSDHKHDITTAAAADVTSATTSAEGTAVSLARSDHTHALTGTLDNNARLAVRRNSGAVVGTRRQINLIEGSNITLTVTDDAGSEEVDITIAAAGGGGGTFLQGTADFGTMAPRPESVTVAIADAGVLAGSRILVSLAPGTGRDADEFELSPLFAMVGAITAGVGFDVLVASLDGDADGQFTVMATRN